MKNFWEIRHVHYRKFVDLCIFLKNCGEREYSQPLRCPLNKPSVSSVKNTPSRAGLTGWAKQSQNEPACVWKSISCCTDMFFAVTQNEQTKQCLSRGPFLFSVFSVVTVGEGERDSCLQTATTPLNPTHWSFKYIFFGFVWQRQQKVSCQPKVGGVRHVSGNYTNDVKQTVNRVFTDGIILPLCANWSV